MKRSHGEMSGAADEKDDDSTTPKASGSPQKSYQPKISRKIRACECHFLIKMPSAYGFHSCRFGLLSDEKKLCKSTISSPEDKPIFIVLLYPLGSGAVSKRKMMET